MPVVMNFEVLNHNFWACWYIYISKFKFVHEGWTAYVLHIYSTCGEIGRGVGIERGQLSSQ